MSKRVLLLQLTAVSLAFDVSGLCHYESCCGVGDGVGSESVIRSDINLAGSLSMLISFLGIGTMCMWNASMTFRFTEQDKQLN
jgi:hypothetical protein